MISFLDGPAAGVVLELRSAPELLRVVRDHSGSWDALDQPDDAPRPSEEVFLYRRVGSAGTAHVDYVDKGRRRVMNMALAQYRHAQP